MKTEKFDQLLTELESDEQSKAELTAAREWAKEFASDLKCTDGV